MKFYVLTIAAVLSLSVFNSCSKKVPAYCTESMFGEVQTFNIAGNPTTTFTSNENIVVNMPFTNTQTDSIFVNYSDPWVEYILMAGDTELWSTASLTSGNGLKTQGIGPLGVVDGTYIIPSGVTPPSTTLTIKARAYYEYMDGCSQGVQVEEKETTVTIL